MKRSQFTWYRSYYEALKTLPAKEFKSVVLAVCAYALDEEDPSLSGVSTVLPSNNTFNRDNPRNRSYKVLACPLYIKTPSRESSALELTEEQDRWYRALHGIPVRRDF